MRVPELLAVRGVSAAASVNKLSFWQSSCQHLQTTKLQHLHFADQQAARAGAKLFYLSGMRNGHYLKREVLNLARFISVMKLRPLTWRSAHPYLLTDRFEVR